MPPDPPAAGDDPEQAFAGWFERARQALGEPASRCVLATADARGRPSARVVYHRPNASGRFRFFTNYDSRKGREIAQNPYAAVVFHWAPLNRQLRLEGCLQRIAAEDSDGYFDGRPTVSRVAAALSPQSHPITSVEDLRAQHAARLRNLAGEPLRRPAHWGGFELQPERIEFWMHGEARLHQRHAFERDVDGWRLQVLAP